MKTIARIKYHLITLCLKQLSKEIDEKDNKEQGKNLSRGAHEMQPQTLSWCPKKTIRDLQKFSLNLNNSELSDIMPSV
jgi:hypothetical protein